MESPFLKNCKTSEVPSEFQTLAAKLFDKFAVAFQQASSVKVVTGGLASQLGGAMASGKEILRAPISSRYVYHITPSIESGTFGQSEGSKVWPIVRSLGFKDTKSAYLYKDCVWKISSNGKYIYHFQGISHSSYGIETGIQIILQCAYNTPDKEKLIKETASMDGTGRRPVNDRTLPESGCDPQEYNRIITEHFDVTDKMTRNTLLVLDESDKSSVLLALTNKLYDNIVNKANDIDYGDIPKSEGDITKIPNFGKLVEAVSLMHDILMEYKQPTGPIDEISVAIGNIEGRRDMFYRAYKNNVELPMMAYCNIVLAIVSGVSYLISTTIEFVKSPKDETFEIALDKVAYAKAKDHLLYTSIKKFNKTCANKDFDKAMDAVMKMAVRQSGFVGAATIATGVGIGVAVIAILLAIIPILRELIFFFYYTRMRVSDFFDIQADLLQMNAYNLEHNDDQDPEQRNKIAAKQYKVVDMFRKSSNVFAINSKKAEVESDKEIKASSKKPKINDVVDEMPDSAASVLF